MMKAMPLTAGSASRSFLHASRPPAEAPIATIGKSGATAGGERLRIANAVDSPQLHADDFQAFCDFSRRATPHGTGKDQ